MQTSVTPIFGVCPNTGTLIQIIGIDYSPGELNPLALLAVRQEDHELVPVRLPRAYALPEVDDTNKAST